MKSCFTRLFPHFQKMRPAFILFISIIFGGSLSAQVLINSGAGGGFESGTTFSSNNWQVANGSATNQWVVGTAVAGHTNRSAYISHDNGVTNTYDTFAVSTVHFYRDITFPAGVPSFTLSFNYIVEGESNTDELLVSLAPTNYTLPTAGLGTGVLAAPAINITRLSRSNGKQTFSTDINFDALGNCVVPVTRRLIFTWKNNGSFCKNPPISVDAIGLVGHPFVINHPADQCENLSDITYSVTPVPTTGTLNFSSSPVNLMVNYTTIFGNQSAYDFFGPPFPQFKGQGTFRASVAPPDVYTILYTYTTSTCVFELTDELEILGTPTVALEDRVIDCVNPGDIIDLGTMLSETDETTDGGTWSVNGSPVQGTDLTVPNASTCYNVTYSVDNQCGPAATDTKKLLVELKSNPDFTINGVASDVFGCEGGMANIDFPIARTSSGNNPSWEVKRGDVVLNNNLTASGGTLSLAPPALHQTVCYSICLTEHGDDIDCSPGVLDNVYPDGYEPCVDVICRNIILYNDGACANGSASSTVFPSECDPDLNNPEFEVCETDPNAYLQLSCYLIKVKIPYKILTASLTSDQCAIFCDSSSFTVRYRSKNVFNEIPGFNTKLKDLSPVVKTICKVLNFCVCVPGLVHWHPLGPIGQWCDASLATIVSAALEEFAGSEGSGGMVVADTDGDGQFDYIIADYDQVPQPISGTTPIAALVPNHMSKKGGIITVRHVTGWPFKATNTCGNPTDESLNLLDVLSPYIDLIPVAGPVINGVLAAANCDIPLAFTDVADVKVPVINSSVPEFKNCPPTGYVFTEDYSCSTAVNWSIPIVEDGCLGELLGYKGRTAATIDTGFNGVPPPVFVVKDEGSGLYQTGGPIVGSILSPGTYTVTYSAFSCRGIQTDCTFPVTVTPGSPVLACPNNIAVATDVDECKAVVTGISPVSGAGCATVINYNVAYPAGSGFPNVNTSTPYSYGNRGIHHDASGLSFPLGITTVTYTMLVDLNGDGDVMDANESQTCSFTVTVFDAQKPKAICVDQEVKLDNTGNATVYAVNPNSGAPFINGGSTDNCDTNPLIEIQKAGVPYGPTVLYNCTDVGDNYVNLRITDDAGNFSTCIGRIKVIDYLDGINLNLDPPALCLEANNPSQLDFSNYLTITLPNGQHVQHADVPTNSFLSGSHGYFFITAFLPDSTSTYDPGSITYDGVYTPGTGSGFITISYLLLPPGFVPPTDSNPPFKGCYEIAHAIFEVRQPLRMSSPECMCVQEHERIVKLGIVTGGLEPYRIEYSGTRLDVNSDGIADDYDGIYTYDAIHGHNINDFKEDLGELRVVYTQPVWSFTIVDARGCEIFRSGSCDNADLLVGPTIPCTKPQVELTTEEYLCQGEYQWQHPIPSDNCAVTLYDYRIINPDGTIDGPHNLNALINWAPGAPPPALLTADYEFKLGTSVVSYYAEDAQGNFTTCTFTVHVVDNDPPHFINCPYPDVVVAAETFHCDAYVNYALPLATDNCDIPLVHQIDNTGLSSGKRFPVGLTVLYYETVDLAGNKDTCRIKVIVNDYWQTPALACPADVVKDNDPWLCSAVVNNIKPTFSSPCQNNLAVTYSVYADAALTQRKACGVWDASGTTFDKGTSWVKYTVQNTPLLLITEVAQSGPVDKLEITNLGPAALDLTCLMVNRTAANPLANEALPVSMLPSLAPTILPVGGVMVFNFTFNGAANMPACYTISFAGVVLDEVAVNGFPACGAFSGTLASGDVIRICEDDSNKAQDWDIAKLCGPLSIGMLNPGLHVMPNNGTKTGLQSIPPNRVSCTFKVTIRDVEDPFCGKLDASTTYTGPGINQLSASACNRSQITVPNNSCIIGDVVFNLTGTATPANSQITLISPYGTLVNIAELPADTLPALFAQKAAGVWTLDVVPNPGFTPTVTGWSLKITCIDTFDMADQVVGNDPGQCGANFTWKHPYFVDNCFEGTISVSYSSADAACLPTGGPLLGKGGYVTTKYFCVGTTTVTYTLVDAAGNTEMCSFDVTVEDRENPVVVCPPTIVVHLDGGACGAFVDYGPLSTSDNCAVVDTVMTPPSGSWFPIGDSIVKITIYDAAGNSATCTFLVRIIEFVPVGNALICNDLTHVSLDSTCVYVIDADGSLEGNNYHCYDDYIVTLKNNQGQIISNILNASNIGKTYTVTVLDPETGNSCWSYVHLEDKLKPALTCPPNKIIACSESTDTPNTGDIIVKDCSAYTKVVDDEYTDFGECGSPRGKIVRTWIVTDVWGNQSTCSHSITITPFNLADVVFPPEAIVDCESVYLNHQATSPDHTGRPSINGAPIGTGGYCSASIGYTDVRLEVCAGSYEIYRTWLVANTCLPAGPNNPISYVQRIRVKDFSGPVFDCPQTVTVSTDPLTCCSTAALPDMLISEGCSRIVGLEAKVTGTNPNNGNIITFTVPGHLGDFPGNNYWIPDTLAIFDYTQCVPLGTYHVRYKAADECGNTSYCFFDLVVADLVPPVAACDQTTTVGINGDDPTDCYTPADGCSGAGVTWVKAKTFDDGSYDNCNQLKFTVRRMAPYSDCITHLSHDPCYPGGLSEFDLATAEGDSVKFYCCEVGTTQTVILRVYQVDVNGNYVPGTDGEPLFNECMIQVEVQDKLKPVCQPPANVTVTCKQFDPSLWVYGKAEVLDNCCLDAAKVYQGQCGLTHTVNYAQFDTLCNKGTITRTFRAFDCHGNSNQCTQRVVVTYDQDYYVRFPNDVIVTVCDGTGNYGEPSFFGEDCELIGVSHEDAIFTVVPDACFKIERSWKIINWCTFNPNGVCIEVPNPTPNAVANHPTNLPGPIVSPIQTVGDPWKSTIVKINSTDASTTNYSTFYDPNANCYTYKQIIKIIDTQDPVVQCPATPVTVCDLTTNDPQLWNEMYWWDNANQSHDLCEAPSDICITATDACSGANINIEYQLFLDLDGDGIMETVVNSTQLGNQAGGLGWNNVLFGNFTGVGQSRQFDGRPVPQNQKWGFAIQETVTGNDKTACVKFNTFQSQNTYVTPQLPHGTHKIKWFVSDGCGNETVCEYTIIVKDCKAPSVVCLNGLSVNIMPTGMIQLWASDFLQYGEDNCTVTPLLKYGIRKCGAGTGFPVDANGDPVTSVTFTCDELGTQCVELWAMDLAGNADYCETYLIVQDNNGNCPNSDHVNVSGVLKTEMGDGVEEGTVNITGSVNFAPPFSYYDLTDNNGIFHVNNSVPIAADFTVSPVKDDNPLNGVTTYDLVLISKHILGIQPLGSPYKMIAADANKSNSITTFDVVELRKLILGIYQELPSNTSWRFVEKSQVFSNPLNPFQDQFPENISVAQAMTHQFGEDFVGVKIGDVNNTVIANSLMTADDRSVGTLLFDVDDRDVKAGEVFAVNFKASEKTLGYQMTLNLNGLEVYDVSQGDKGNGNVNAGNFGVFNDPGTSALTVSINDADAFTVKFRANKSGKLSEMMNVSSRITKAEGYSMANVSSANASAGKLDIALRYSSPAGMTISGVGFELYQNEPNPFVNKTFVGFHLPEAATATLSVFDETGRVVFTQKGDFAKGYNTIALDRALLNTTGVLYYKLETARDSATKKMIQVR